MQEVRGDGQKPQSQGRGLRGELAHDSKAHRYAACGQRGACAPTVRLSAAGKSAPRAVRMDGGIPGRFNRDTFGAGSATSHFGISQYYRPLPELDDWIRRRMRMCLWKQRRWVRTKIKHLLNLGVNLKTAIQHRASSKSHWHMARTPAVQQALSNAWLKAQGLLSVKDLWCKAQGYTVRTSSSERLVEPPTADPHGGWCGGWELATPGYPIRSHQRRARANSSGDTSA